jgi:hypothetical protein
MARVTLLGFPQDLASQLSRILLAEAHTVDRKRYIQDLTKRSRPSLVFVCADTPGFLDTVSALKDAEPGLPFVVTTRMPDPIQWLNALEARSGGLLRRSVRNRPGALDYGFGIAPAGVSSGGLSAARSRFLPCSLSYGRGPPIPRPSFSISGRQLPLARMALENLYREDGGPGRGEP